MSKFDLVVRGIETESGIEMKFEYNADLFEGPTIERMMGYFVTLAAGVIKDPDRKISGMEILDPGEKDLILNTFGATPPVATEDTVMHAVFEETARAVPCSLQSILNKNN